LCLNRAIAWQRHLRTWALGLLATSLFCACTWPEQQVVDYDIDVDAKLVGAASSYGTLYISEDGLVLNQSGARRDLGDHVLRDIDSLMTDPPSVVIVGDDGYVVFGVGLGLEETTWYELEPGTDADLRAVTMFDRGDPAELLVVGDGILLRATQTGPGKFDWVEPLAPPSGWGSLRDVMFDPVYPFRDYPPDQAVVAVGDDGRLLTSDEAAFDWTLQPLDTDADLSCVSGRAWGERGTMVRRNGAEWMVTQVDPTVDYVACDSDLVVDSNRRVHDVWNEVSVELDWQPLAVQQGWLVGDEGRVGKYVYDNTCNVCDPWAPFSPR
jgi:hypothetical protein